MKPNVPGGLSILTQVAAAVLVAAVFALFTRAFLVQAYRIGSDSMAPALLVGDHLLINKFIFGAGAGRWGPLVPQREVRRGDLVTFQGLQHPSQEVLKRCVATAGDEVEIDAKRLRLNGVAVDETSYAVHSDPLVYAGSDALPETVWRRDSVGPVKVPERSLFCLGDNRDVSRDSRFFGPVKTDLVRGRPFIVYWSRRREAGRPDVRWRRTLHIPR